MVGIEEMGHAHIVTQMANEETDKQSPKCALRSWVHRIVSGEGGLGERQRSRLPFTFSFLFPLVVFHFFHIHCSSVVECLRLKVNLEVASRYNTIVTED